MSLDTSFRISPELLSEAFSDLEKFVSIRSVSNPDSPDYSTKNLEEAASFVKTQLEDLGFEVKYSQIEDSPAFVLAQKVDKIGKPTILFYGHYDVQPVDREKWDTDPFVLTKKGDRLYARGASDDKAGILAILFALKAYKAHGRELPVNIKVLFEGEEEYGSSHMQELLKREKEYLKADALVVMDGGNINTETGTLEVSTRGVLTMRMAVNALKKPTHSGVGCLVPDPTLALCSLVSSLKDPKKIPGFFDDCIALSKEESKMLKDASVSEVEYIHEHGVLPGGKLRGDVARSIFERIVEEPSISIINFTSGKPNGGNSIQDRAVCEFGIRLTPGQDPKRMESCVVSYLKSQELPYGLKSEIERISLCAKSWKADISKPFSRVYLSALEDVFGKVALMPTGGTLPLFDYFAEAYPGIDAIVTGIEDPDTAAHSHNESQHIGVFEKAVNSVISFLDKASSI